MGYRKQDGYSLVEMVVALGIIAVIALGVQRFTSNVATTQARQASRDYAVETNKRILQYIQRDFKYRFDNNTYQINNGNLRLRIDRRQRYDINDSDARYAVNFETLCTTITNLPNEVQQTLARVYSNANRNDLAGKGRCFQAANCPARTYPQIRIRTDVVGNRVPTYNPTLNPDFLGNQNQSSAIQKGIVGSAFCAFQQAGSNRMRVAIDTAYIRSRQTQDNQETFVLEVVSEESILTEGSIAGDQVQILPD